MSRKTAKALAVLLAAGCFVALGTAAFADTYLIKTNGTGDFATIQDAINALGTGDVIELEDGTFDGPGNVDVDFMGKAVTVRSQSGDATACTIDCDGSSFDPHRAFWFHSGEGNASVIQNISIVNGFIEDGNGGAILCEGAAPTIEGCIFGSNIVDGTGVMGGAIYMDTPSYFVMTGCRFMGNTAGEMTDGNGGAVALFGAEQAEFHECTFGPGNYAGVRGGGVYLSNSDAHLEGCTITDNGAQSGAGVFSASSNLVSMSGCSLLWNEAATGWGEGGGLTTYGSVNITGCTFMGNFAAVAGGGIHFGDTGVGDVTRCIIAFSLMGGGINAAPPDRSWNIQCCNVYDNTGGNYVGSITDQTGLNNNISEDPLFCDAPSGDVTIYNTSGCTEEFSPCGERIGAEGIGCYTPVEDTSWGAIKSRF